MTLTIKQVKEDVGSLSKPSKMPGHGYSTPAKDCITGSKLAKIVNSYPEPNSPKLLPYLFIDFRCEPLRVTLRPFWQALLRHRLLFTFLNAYQKEIAEGDFHEEPIGDDFVYPDC